MKTPGILLLITFYFIPGVYSQNIDAVWPLGYACCQYPGFGAANLTFTQGSLTIGTTQRHQNFNETNGSACDSAGILLFTSNGFYVANALDDTMQNGSGLNPSYYTTQHIHNGLTLPQANLVIPSLTNSKQFILFHNTIDDYINTGASTMLYYSIIDMSLNNGLGAVIYKNTIVYTDSMAPGRITASRHANGRDWWIVVHKLHSADLFEFLYTPQGIFGPYQKNLLTSREFYAGQCGFNPQGTKYAYYDFILGLEIADFDRCTGDFSNVSQHTITDSSVYGAGLAFSASGRYLYVSTFETMYQYDTWASNIDSSRITVGVYDGFIDTLTTNVLGFELEALAPDGKIYISTANSTPYLHVINYPDSAGLACDFCQHCIVLPVVNGFTMPNFPNYALGAEAGSICDSLSIGIDVVLRPELFSVYPNPAKDIITIRFSLERKGELIIYNQLGQMVFQKQLTENKSELTIDMSGFQNGIYSCKLTSGGQFDVLPLVIIQ